MHILLTGISGFVCSHLLEHILINTDWRITGIYRNARTGDLNRIEEIKNRYPDFDTRVKMVRHDLLDPLVSIHKHIGKVDYIAHLAANSSVEYSIDNPIEVFHTNAMSTANMLEYTRKYQPELKKFIYYSTDEVQGPCTGRPYTEDDRLRPSNPYSAGKAAGEMIAHAYMVTHGLPVLVTRTMNVFGERQDPEKLIPKTIGRFLAGKPMLIHGEPKDVGIRHWLHARNAADATLFLLKHDIVQDYVNIVGTTQKNTLEVTNLIAKIMNHEPEYVFQSYDQVRQGHDKRYAMSGKKLKKLGWRPPLGFKESLKKTVEWTLNHPQWVQLFD